MKNYYMNKDTGELLTKREMLEQWKTEYDGDDPTNMLSVEEQYVETLIKYE